MGLLSKFIRTQPKSTSIRAAPEFAPTSIVADGSNAQDAVSTSSGFAVVDMETTGLSPSDERILELGIVCTSPTGEVVDEWASRFNPQGRMGATHIHGITAADVAGAPSFAHCIETIVPLLRGRVLVAHNAVFDLAFLRAEFERAGWQLPEVPALCTLKASWFYQPDLIGRRLPECCQAAGVRVEASHYALEDARSTAALLHLFLDPHTPPPPLAEHLDLVQRAASISWPTGPAPAGTTSSSRGPVVIAVPRRRSEPIRLTAALISTLASYPLEDALDEGATEGSTAYLQLVLEVLEDGELSVEEGIALAELAREYGLSDEDRSAAHRGFLVALARKAVEDDHVSREEREELRLVARLLDLPEKLVPDVLSGARDQRTAHLGEGLAPLPDDWALGEPLRVGDRICFTGCEAYGRQQLERQAEEAGLTVAGGVSRSTALLVSDGTISGTKARAAQEYGIRVVHPDVFKQLAAHVQPALPKAAKGKTPRPQGQTSSRKVTADAGWLDAGQTNGDVDPAVVRQWARANGIPVGSRGRLHQDVFDAYRRANELDDGQDAPAAGPHAQ